MAAKKTSYIDADGLRQTGYIIDGSTYTDPAGTQPVARGSIVEAGGKRYVKGVGQSGESVLFSDYLKSAGLSSADYVDPQGQLKTGYIKDGVTYSDILATKPVAKGSIVSAGAQQWVKGAGDNGESLLYADYIKKLQGIKPPAESGGAEAADPFSRIMEESKSAYDKALLSNDEIYKSRVQENAEKLQRSKAELGSDYKDLNTQLYRDYMLSRKNIPQALAAQGISGGLSESSLLGLEAGYQGNLARNERERISALLDLETESSAAELELAIEKAKADAAAGDSYAQRRLETLEAMEARSRQQSEAAAKSAEAAAEMLYSKALDKARILAAAGDFSGYRALGYSDEEIAALEAQWFLQQGRKR